MSKKFFLFLAVIPLLFISCKPCYPFDKIMMDISTLPKDWIKRQATQSEIHGEILDLDSPLMKKGWTRFIDLKQPTDTVAYWENKACNRYNAKFTAKGYCIIRNENIVKIFLLNPRIY